LLSFYAKYFDTVEINNSFYHLPKIKTFNSWRETVPKNFVFALKASRFITHMKKLKAPKTSSKKLFDRMERLEETLGPILFQLPTLRTSSTNSRIVRRRQYHRDNNELVELSVPRYKEF